MHLNKTAWKSMKVLVEGRASSPRFHYLRVMVATKKSPSKQNSTFQLAQLRLYREPLCERVVRWRKASKRAEPIVPGRKWNRGDMKKCKMGRCFMREAKDIQAVTKLYLLLRNIIQNCRDSRELTFAWHDGTHFPYISKSRCKFPEE